MITDNELTTLIINEVPSADCVADWQQAERYAAERHAEIVVAEDVFDWSEFKL